MKRKSDTGKNRTEQMSKSEKEAKEGERNPNSLSWSAGLQRRRRIREGNGEGEGNQIRGGRGEMERERDTIAEKRKVGGKTDELLGESWVLSLGKLMWMVLLRSRWRNWVRLKKERSYWWLSDSEFGVGVLGSKFVRTG
ncbi:hypothetical protein Droror1_Dr00008794 [Drosera rotundifolia]